MFLSVIIPTRNRAPLLAKCLESLCTQSYPKDSFEVLVVDNGSTDDTAAVCDAFGQHLPQLRSFFAPNPGQHTGRNLGFLEARGDILVYGDDDIVASKEWLAAIAEAFQDPDVTLVGGRNLPDFETSPPGWGERLWRRGEDGCWLGLYSVCDLGDVAKDISPYRVYGCNFSIRRAFLEEIGGFHPDVMPRDLMVYMGDGDTGVSQEVAVRGRRARYHPQATVKHFVSSARMTHDYLLQRMFGQGISDSYTRIRSSGGLAFKDVVNAWLRRANHWLHGLVNPFYRPLWRAYWDGYRMHRREARSNHRLLSWIIRDSYVEDGTV